MKIARIVLGVSIIASLVGTQPVVSALAQNEQAQPTSSPTIRILPGNVPGQVRVQIVMGREGTQIVEANQLELLMSAGGLRVDANGPGSLEWAPTPKVPFTRYQLRLIGNGELGHIEFQNRPGQD
jgi:hypothetical protein